MRSIYSWQIRGYLWAFATLLLSQIVILSVGINVALNAYTQGQLASLHDLAVRILVNPESESEPVVEHSGPFFVFSADKALVYTNRGRGRSISSESYRPVEYDGNLIGYFYADDVRFLSSVANRVFLASLGVLAAGSMVVSFGIAALAAIRASRRIATPVTELQVDIEALRTLRTVEKRELAVTELAAMSASVHTVSERLVGEEEYKRQWMQDIAHDLRTPISGLKSQLEGMRDGVLDPSEDRIVRTLAEVNRLEEMVAGMNELHSIERTESIQAATISVESLVTELRTAFEARLRERSVEYVTTTEALALKADRGLLLRALGNIVENALAYAGDGARLEVSVSEASGGTIIRLANDGPTIPEEQLPRLFDRFYRGDSGRSKPGAGLGLNIAHEIIARHGGSIHVRNLEPRGVEFVIELPA